MKVELSKPFVDQECLDAMVRAASSGKHILQDECKSFEAEFAAYVGTKHAVLTNSGTSAIFLVLKAGTDLALPMSIPEGWGVGFFQVPASDT